jgi:radical SAM superfamily enzyme
VDAVRKTAELGINTGAHFIFGLPGESRQEMLNEVDLISAMPLKTVKFHQLQIIRGTTMEKEFEANPSEFELFTWDEYLEFFISFLERLNPEIVVERFIGEAPPRYLTGIGWGKKRTDQIVNLVEKRLEELNTWQGRLYNNKNQQANR